MKSVPNTELVPGDIVLLDEGDAVGADCRLIEAANLQVSEAPLTGESVPVDKTLDVLDVDTDLADRSNMVFRGTAVTSGRGTAVVVSTAMTPRLGRLRH